MGMVSEHWVGGSWTNAPCFLLSGSIDNCEDKRKHRDASPSISTLRNNLDAFVTS
jgi:hypothetical protein